MLEAAACRDQARERAKQGGRRGRERGEGEVRLTVCESESASGGGGGGGRGGRAYVGSKKPATDGRKDETELEFPLAFMRFVSRELLVLPQRCL